MALSRAALVAALNSRFADNQAKDIGADDFRYFLAEMLNYLDIDGTLTPSIAQVATLTNNLNYATNKGWVVGGNIDQVGFFGGNFQKNSTGNSMVFGKNQFGLPALLWNVAGNVDGGFSKNCNNIKYNASYLTAIYFRKNSSASNTGLIYYGCEPNNTLEINGTANTNPYFLAIPYNNLTQGEWYVAIGIINANGIVLSSNLSGVYQLSTGQKVLAGTDFKLKPTSTIQGVRVFALSPSEPTISIDFSSPFFAELTSDLGDLFYFLGINGQFPYMPDKITITPPVGTSMVYNLRRPYKFAYTLIYNDGLTLVAQPSATVAANTDAFLTLTNATVGKSVTVQILQIP